MTKLLFLPNTWLTEQPIKASSEKNRLGLLITNQTWLALTPPPSSTFGWIQTHNLLKLSQVCCLLNRYHCCQFQCPKCLSLRKASVLVLNFFKYGNDDSGFKYVRIKDNVDTSGKS